MKRALLLILVAGLLYGGWRIYQRVTAPEMALFEGVSGPEAPSAIPEPVPVRLEDYDRGGSSRLAVLVTEPDSAWLGLVRGFKAQGIPFTLTRDPARAMRHQVVIVYPSISGRLLSGPSIRALAQYIRSGNTLLTFDLAGGGLEELFGISAQRAARGRDTMRWLIGPVEDRNVYFGNPRADAAIGSLAFTPTSAQPLAVFADGSAGATCRRVGGRACLLGIDLGAMAERSMNGRAQLMSPSFVNGYEPSLDAMFRWVRSLYVEGEDHPFLVHTAPAGRAGSLILTHDVDFNRSPANSVAYADAIRRRGVGATFLIQTKYIKDWNDSTFFDPANLPHLKKVAQGMELGSHSVSHSRAFSNFRLGTGTEYYPRYQPFVVEKMRARGGSILGELRVSKYLIDHLLGAEVRSFRPGHLSFPEGMPEALAATGYRYSSTLTANNTLTHLPFQLSYSRTGSALVPVWEFPVTIEDELPPRLDRRLDAANALIERIARNGGVAVTLIHPDVTAHKLWFEEQLIDRWKGRLWIGSLGDFGNWWTARDAAEFDYDGNAVTVRAPAGLNGVTLFLPKDPRRGVVFNRFAGRGRFILRGSASPARAAQSR